MGLSRIISAINDDFSKNAIFLPLVFKHTIYHTIRLKIKLTYRNKSARDKTN